MKSNSNNKGIPDSMVEWGASVWRAIRLRTTAIPASAEDEAPLRAELLSAEQMEQHGRVLAGAHKLGVKRAPDQLLARLADNEAVLVGVSSLLTATLRENRRITPAGEWLLDNFYLIEEQIRTAKRHLPKGYSRELPRLAFGPSAGRPRVYDIALESVSHGDGRIDQKGLRRFVTAYQKVTVLTLGELWAIPIMLRLALIENLRRVAARISSAATDREQAGSWADQMIEVAEKDPKSLILMIADMARSGPPVSSPFVSEFARRLQGQSAALALPLTWIEQRLSESSQTIEQLVQAEAQKQASDQVYVSNSIASLRFLGAVDWREFVESMSVVDKKLREDPDGSYGRMEFATRDRYRHVVEAIARRSPLSESDVARKAVQLANDAAARRDGDDRAAHVGFYLVDKGLPQLQRAAQARPSAAATLRLAAARHPLPLYLGAIALLTLSLGAVLLARAHADGAGDLLLVLTGLLSILGASQLAVALVNWMATLLVAPHSLPRLDFSAGIPAQFRTLVVVPTMLSSVRGIDDLAEALEVRYLANQDDNLRFGLLTDWHDATAQSIAGDAVLLSRAAAAIDELNRKYPGPAADAGDRFFLFHRPRFWNAGERIWMGYERKRGKLADLNALLRGGAPDRFSLVVGAMDRLSDVKYVITLDTDTQLPRDSARQIVGTMAHPLNRARLDIERQRVRDGYAILQPRVASSLPSTNRSRYARLFGSESGIDPYTSAVSDVYQDLFAEGSFIGKGIYDVDAFELALKGRFPENRILSHDLLEGCYARAGLISDVQLVEEFPSGYIADMDRRRRWVRGDWQIATWLLTRVPHGEAGDRTADGKQGHASNQSNPLSVLSQWKLLDNLRRSLVPAALTLLLVLGWTVLAAPGFWTLAVFGLVLLPPALVSAHTLARKPEDMPFQRHVTGCLGAAGWPFAQAAFTLACLPYEACVTLDAIVRTHVRVLFTRRRLLEWNPSHGPAAVKTAKAAKAAHHTHGAAIWLAMWSAPVIATLAAITILAIHDTAVTGLMGGTAALTSDMLVTLLMAGPVLFIWFFSPAIAAWLSGPLARRVSKLTPEQGVFLRRQARKTWAFFDTFVGAQDNWLPPDNLQERRGMLVAHRTSPTNIGLALLANLSAYDFGYLPAGSLLERSANTLRTMAALERHRGHFFNWYDTLSLQPLHPRYISAVDSGNLAGHLLTLRQGLLALPKEPLFSLRVFEGLGDTIGILTHAAGPLATAAMERMHRDLESAYDARPANIAAAWRWLDRLATTAAQIKSDVESGAAASLARGLNAAAANAGNAASGQAAQQPDAPHTQATTQTDISDQADQADQADQGTAGSDTHIHRDAAHETEAPWWADALHRQCRSAASELLWLAPWLALPAAPSRLAQLPGMDAIHAVTTLQQLAGLELAWAHGSQQAHAVHGAHVENVANMAPDADTQLALPLAMVAMVAGAAGQDAGTGRQYAMPADATLEERDWLDQLQQSVALASERAHERLAGIAQLALQAEEFARMEYDFLYDPSRHLLAIGYNVDERRRDSSYYDLLASEARLACFVAIAQGELPQESWFALGRLLTSAGGEPMLMSWSGSMFEYLMPLLVMPTYDNTLLDQTCRGAVARQIDYGRQRGVPWGLSESGYNAVDVSLSYQYRAFGVPGLGLKRGLAEDLVVAPYASALALMVVPAAACQNMQRLAADGLEGRYGLFEAIDYTPARQRRGQSSAIVYSYMAHHQGMTLVSLGHALLDRPMQRRFLSSSQIKATTLLLQERIPKVSAVERHVELSDIRAISSGPEMPVRVFTSPDTAAPEVQLLSNGRYHVMLSNAGGGYSRWKDIAVTRWREDSTTDHWGSFCFIRDTASGDFWSGAHQPTLDSAPGFEATFSESRAEFRRRHHDIESHLEIVVSPEDDIELRRLHLTNGSRVRRVIEVTTYAEVVLAPAMADALHPAFGNLFVQTEIVRDRQAILCTRRPRSVEENPPWLFHLMAVHGAGSAAISYETDRLRFIGRGGTLAAPRAMREPAALSGGEGSVLDPIIAIRRVITLEPEQVVIVDMVTGIGETREAALGLAGKYHDRHLAERVFELARTHGWVTLRQINATESDAQLYGRLAGAVIYSSPALRADAAVLMKNRRGQSSLWGYAISGDLPIVLLQIGDLANIDLVRELVQAHAWWRLKGLAVDLLIWNEDRAGYRQVLQDQIIGLIAAGIEAHVMDRPGGIFVRRAEQISDEDRILIQSVARAIISDRRGALGEQINRRGLMQSRAPHLNLPRHVATRSRRAETRAALVDPETMGADGGATGGASLGNNFGADGGGISVASSRTKLIFGNGLGGFSRDGREYVIITSRERLTPAPWVNVLANAHFGSIVSESGPSYTWSENAHEFRLTPWSSDAVCDASGEAFYLRDDESGHYWSPTPSPVRGASAYMCRHGFGYSVFEHAEEGIRSELTVYVDRDAAVKFSVLKLRNDSNRQRQLSATGYVEWVLGDLRPKTAPHVITEIDPASGALFARNAYNTEFADRIAFFDVDETTRSVSGDRAEFIGRNGTLGRPVAMSRAQLSNKLGAALDPCAAIQVPFALAAGEEREIIFRLGVAGRRGADEANKLVRRFRGAAAAQQSLETVRQYWAVTLGAVQVQTPDPALDVLVNGWLLYQTLACRIWARSGHYQSGGAFGFRDQLQDAMALVHVEPALLREHLLRCAARQFREGDVQHWWHPSSGRGVRTRCSDDYLWLPLAVSRYVEATGDGAALDEPVPFLEGRPVSESEDSYYDLPGRSVETASLYDHCVRAVLMGLRFGTHGLPLIGGGDWNDGMNMVGAEGKGESVWLGFFLYDVLTQFGAVARQRGDAALAERCRAEAILLQRNIEQHGWDGEWYRRAYFDDGTPLGSAGNSECQIDSIAQSWSVLSGAGDAARSRQAMDALDRRLVRRDAKLVQLLDPPFDKSATNPGYIKGYVPGVRENGGQYTHAAIWAAMAFAELGDHARAWELTTMINPLNHANTPAAVDVYKVEPYAIAADVYAVTPHTGRGGWTWYTGSAGWMYRLVVESLLGLRLEADRLRFEPCLPEEWAGFSMRYRHGETTYRITVRQRGDGKGTATGGGGTSVTVDGIPQQDRSILLTGDRAEHDVEVTIVKAVKLLAVSAPVS